MKLGTVILAGGQHFLREGTILLGTALNDWDPETTGSYSYNNSCHYGQTRP